MPFRPDFKTLGSSPGTYALLLVASRRAAIRIGRLGRLELEPGHYVYIGSALGPGGLGARIAHHARPTVRPHWHIDYLRARSRLEGLWWCNGSERLEHDWANAVADMPGAVVPLKGFGASDCRCLTHLYYFRNRPEFRLAAPIREPA